MRLLSLRPFCAFDFTIFLGPLWFLLNFVGVTAAMIESFHNASTTLVSLFGVYHFRDIVFIDLEILESSGVNISPYFLDARQGKGFGFLSHLGKGF